MVQSTANWCKRSGRSAFVRLRLDEGLSAETSEKGAATDHRTEPRDPEGDALWICKSSRKAAEDGRTPKRKRAQWTYGPARQVLEYACPLAL